MNSRERLEPLEALEGWLETTTGRPSRIRATSGISGGCINEAMRLDLEDGRRYFLKQNPRSPPGMFAAEAMGLKSLRDAGAIRVPEVIGHGEIRHVAFLVLEHVQEGPRRSDFFAEFGRRFARLHQTTRASTCGGEIDNYIGSTPQPNRRTSDWVVFFRDQRLGHQFALARSLGVSTPRLEQLGDRLLDDLARFIGEPAEDSCLLHGDLWSGNFMGDEAGDPLLIDPAAYHGRREADLAMTQLFGGFPRQFHDAYHEVWPLAAGWKDRLEIYKLYHILNHLNLFGASYRRGALDILERFVG